MKTTKLKSPESIITSGVFALMIVLIMSSCTGKIDFLVSKVAPAARGYVQVHTDKNRNYVIDIHIIDLAEISRIQPAKQSYVVWLVTDQFITKNIGQINSSAKMLSKTLEASFKTVSAFKPTKIFITAEADANVQNPNEPVVITTDVF